MLFVLSQVTGRSQTSTLRDHLVSELLMALHFILLPPCTASRTVNTSYHSSQALTQRAVDDIGV